MEQRPILEFYRNRSRKGAPIFRSAYWRDASLSQKLVTAIGSVLLLVQVPIETYDIYSMRSEVHAHATQHAATALDMFSGALVHSMMRRNGTEDDEVSNQVFDGQMEHFSQISHEVELWTVMSPELIRYQRAQGLSEIESPRDALDREALRTGETVSGQTADEVFRVVRPLVLGEGAAAHESCISCHRDQMGMRVGEPIGAVSVAVDLSHSLAEWRNESWREIAGALALVAIILPLIYFLLDASALQPLRRLATSTRAIARGELETSIEDRDRIDEIGAMASALDVFRANALAVRRLTQERETARAIEQTRHEEREKVQNELNNVLRAVLSGDFSARLSGRYVFTELNALTAKMNQVIAGADLGRRTIAAQAETLQQQVSKLQELLRSNTTLRDDLKRVSEAMAGMNEALLQRIGADLHDGPAQMLTYAAMRLVKLRDAVAKAEGPDGVERFDNLRDAVDAALREVRTISTGLALPKLATANLVEAIQMAVDFHREHTGSDVDFSVEGPAENASEALKLCLYRITQEALSNGYRHGGGVAQRVSLRAIESRSLEIEVSDAGPGFDPTLQSNGLGLAGMRARVEALSGDFDIVSAPGRGAAIRARFSLRQRTP